jgi:hypothetical protein
MQAESVLGRREGEQSCDTGQIVICKIGTGPAVRPLMLAGLAGTRLEACGGQFAFC